MYSLANTVQDIVRCHMTPVRLMQYASGNRTDGDAGKQSATAATAIAVADADVQHKRSGERFLVSHRCTRYAE